MKLIHIFSSATYIFNACNNIELSIYAFMSTKQRLQNS